MLNDRENILNALREKPLKVYEIMKRANVVNEEACQCLLLKMRECKICPIALPSNHAIRMHHQSLGLNT